MTSEWLSAMAAIVSLIGSVIVGLLALAAKAEVATLRAEIAFGTQKIETIRVEVRASIAEAVNEFYIRVNGNYVKKEVFKIAMGGVDDRLVQIRKSVGE